MRVNSSSCGGFILVSGPMISCTSPPEQKFPPAPVMTMALIGDFVLQSSEKIPQLRIGLEGQRVLALGPVQRDHADLALARATGNASAAS